MYLFLESITEFLDRFSLVIVGGLMGGLAVVFFCNKVKLWLRLRILLTKAKIARLDRKIKAFSKDIHPKIFKSALAIAFFMWIAILIGLFGILIYVAIYHPDLFEKLQ